MTMRSAARMASTASGLASTRAGLSQTRRMPRERMMRDWPSRCEPSASSALRLSGDRGRRHDLAAHGQDAVGQPDALLEVAR